MEFKRADFQNEFDLKITRIQDLLERRGLDALLLRKVSSFAWITCGASSYVVTANTEGIASVLVTPTKRYLMTNNIEFPRLKGEESLGDQGWEYIYLPWYSEENPLEKLCRGMKIGADGFFPGAVDLSNDITWLRSQLTPQEGQRFRVLSNICAQGMQEAIEAVRPGMTEFQIAGLLAQSVESGGVQAIGNMVATDERIFKFRHPLPTSKSLTKYAMLILCGRRWGLVCSVSRLVYFGRLPDELRSKAEAAAYVDAVMISATRPGNTLSEIFRSAQKAYASKGFGDEWQNHHQGGSVGYEPREITATPQKDVPVMRGQVFAWNPSIAGVKSEDSVLVGEKENEILTLKPDWPALDIYIGDQCIKRPAILERD